MCVAYVFRYHIVGYTMRDILYKWNAGLRSFIISNEVQLPQFQVLGHRQKSSTINLTTGKLFS